jgi:hypothetical protein
VFAGAEAPFTDNPVRRPRQVRRFDPEAMEKPPMSLRTRTNETRGIRPIRETLARIGFGVTGALVGLTIVLSAATVWLVLTRPLAVADVLEERQVAGVIQALAVLVMSLLSDLVGYL